MEKIKNIFEKQESKNITVSGWVLSNRGNKKIRFITINDGSTFENLQIVIKGEAAGKYDVLRIGSAIKVNGEIIKTPQEKQSLELIAKKIDFKITTENFPLQKQGISLETLRNWPHLRHRTNLFRAIFQIRSTLMFEIHAFLNQENFLNVTTPIITGNDAEGAGEAFLVEAQEKDFFGKKASLGVSGQLHAEAYSTGFGDVYTFGPTFRAENSHTQRHVAEFWMLEVESAFYHKHQMILFTDKMLKQVIKNTLAKHELEFAFLDQRSNSNLLEKLNNFINQEIKIITYTEAIRKLSDYKTEFIDQNLDFGVDLATEHERFLAEKIYHGPVAVTDYPKDIKAFYMKINEDQKTVAAFDILVPGVGEMIGGSERETSFEKLKSRIKALNLSSQELEWYLNLRNFGQMESTGFGLGFARLVMYVTGMDNIRDVISFPRTPKNLKM